ncbi:2-phospho-L-lactate transferase [Methanospirillum purgamenti]|jgi:LPPG:FO 2-phospho-L-lactate transferase|uniref:2-phospho-L-lactate transferase n=1 Tax=Methanospirillum hungatei TaxID=2203 RepID=A0A8F5VKJ8_METHU|nr:2-phospho-L-lactate transferase [Methanospirillum hungatei]QXO93726.1 2-phospho-L-lactate transferase [Methanospirillum hungatei]
MITFLSGGTGTPKLLQGARRVLKDTDISVIVNTGEDIWYQGGHISPDVDTVMYLFSGMLNTTTWWGVNGDTFITHEIIRKVLSDAYMSIGDRDRAVHIIRAELLESGMTLTQVTKELCCHFGITGTILPMSDSAFTTYVRTEEGEIHFQEYWVKNRGKTPILSVIHKPEKQPSATDEVLKAIRNAEAIVIGPSNPVTSILPILSCTGVREELARKKVIAISPFIGDSPVSGPAKELMQSIGYQADSGGVRTLYGELIQIFIQDTRDTVSVPGSIRHDTLMKSPEIAEDLMKMILSLCSG